METTAQVLEVHKAGKREWTGLAVLALPTLMVAMDMTVCSAGRAFFFIGQYLRWH
ncbi:MAG TPA: hypothetical protein VM802_28340 [Chitinophaga sp.]|uniref:hypothetical protein n=1 Tax=Chitinophaga sp. TaxID=1869181 RepID=UPI002BCC219A|nr:hypothetical protein [Chitinophaga sp.]HVI48812.1 hypothetical protein [Chitinophaga sp.]